MQGHSLTTVVSTLLNASLTPKQVHAFYDHVELLIRARVYDAQTFTLLTDPQPIMAIVLHFMTSKFMERVPVPDWKTDLEVSTILEALRECYLKETFEKDAANMAKPTLQCLLTATQLVMNSCIPFPTTCRAWR
jgi:hypothetical protein